MMKTCSVAWMARWSTLSILVLCSILRQSAGNLGQSLGREAALESDLKRELGPSPPSYHVMFLLVSHLSTSWKHLDIMSIEQLNITAEMVLPNSFVHVLTNDEAVLSRVENVSSAVPWGDRLIAKDVRPFMEVVREPFMKFYKHQSGNDRELVAHWMWRWGLFSRYVEDLIDSGVNVRRVLTLDSDVMPTRPVHQWLPIDMDERFESDGRVVVFARGAAVLWTPVEIHSFWYFLVDLYHTPEKLKSSVLRSVLYAPGSCNKEPGHSEVMPCAENDRQWHYDDMSPMAQYVEEVSPAALLLNNINSVGNPTEPPYNASSPEWAGYSCAVMTYVSYAEHLSWRLVVKSGPSFVSNPRSDKGWSIMFPKSPWPVCFLHFNGGGNKPRIGAVAKFITARVNESTLDYGSLKI